jgi:hypothetical protein
VEVADVHPEDTVLGVEFVANLSEEGRSPAAIGITPGAVVVLSAVRVSDLDEVVACGGLLDTENGEGVTLNEARSRLSLVEIAIDLTVRMKLGRSLYLSCNKGRGV